MGPLWVVLSTDPVSAPPSADLRGQNAPFLSEHGSALVSCNCFDFWSFFTGVAAPTTCGLLLVLNYMIGRVFHPRIYPCCGVFHPDSGVGWWGISSWKTPPDPSLLWMNPPAKPPVGSPGGGFQQRRKKKEIAPGSQGSHGRSLSWERQPESYSTSCRRVGRMAGLEGQRTSTPWAVA